MHSGGTLPAFEWPASGRDRMICESVASDREQCNGSGFAPMGNDGWNHIKCTYRRSCCHQASGRHRTERKAFVFYGSHNRQRQLTMWSLIWHANVRCKTHSFAHSFVDTCIAHIACTSIGCLADGTERLKFHILDTFIRIFHIGSVCSVC